MRSAKDVRSREVISIAHLVKNCGFDREAHDILERATVHGRVFS